VRTYYSTMACDECGKVVFHKDIGDDATYNWPHLTTFTGKAGDGSMEYVEWDFCGLDCLAAWAANHKEARK